jgi:hypothetical protein
VTNKKKKLIIKIHPYSEQEDVTDIIKKINSEIIIIKNGNIIKTPAYAAHLLIAIEDSIVFETSDENKTTVNYQKYRNQIKK